jgi:hypothetical protein
MKESFSEVFLEFKKFFVVLEIQIGNKIIRAKEA